VNKDIRNNGYQYKPENILTIYDLKDITSEGIERLVENGAISSEKY